jgi:hypothetical protein
MDHAEKFVSADEPGHLTADLCRAKAVECLHLAKQNVSGPHRIMLEHIAETWYRIADSLLANDA